MPVELVSDQDPYLVLDALDRPGPVVVTNHRLPVPTDLRQRLARVAPDTWLVAFTSGSTAHPRGVCRTRASWMLSVAPLAAAIGAGTSSTVLVPGPLSSTLFLHGAWHAREVGARVLLGPLDSAKPWDIAHLLPSQLAALLASPADLTGRTAVVAGAALAGSTAAAAMGRGMRVVRYYGAAELSFVAIGSEDGLRPFPGVEVAERAAELWVRSPYVAAGYLPDVSDGDPAGGAMRRDEAGWATVGDRGEVRADGTVVVRGRGAGVVQTGAATIHAADVEHVLRGAPGVRDAVVVGVPHAWLGQVVAAAVESSSATSATMRRWARSRLDSSALPRRWVVTNELPRTPAGKVDRDAVSRLVARGHPSD